MLPKHTQDNAYMLLNYIVQNIVQFSSTETALASCSVNCRTDADAVETGPHWLLTCGKSKFYLAGLREIDLNPIVYKSSHEIHKMNLFTANTCMSIFSWY